MADTNVTETILPCRLLPVKTRGTPLPDRAAELEALARECRRFPNAEAYANATAPLGTEPRVTYTVLDAAGKAYRAMLSCPQDLHPGDEVVTDTPSRWRLRRWQVRVAAHARAVAIYEALAATPLLKYQPISDMPAFPVLHRRVGASIGAVRFARVGPMDKMFSLTNNGLSEGPGVEYLLPEGMVALNMADVQDAVYVNFIEVAPQRKGLGRRVMGALKRYCDERQRRLIVYLVTQPGFYAALGWMEPKFDGGEFIYEPWRANSARPAVAGLLGKEQNVDAFTLARA